jgi:hypothetical protein
MDKPLKPEHVTDDEYYSLKFVDGLPIHPTTVNDIIGAVKAERIRTLGLIQQFMDNRKEYKTGLDAFLALSDAVYNGARPNNYVELMFLPEVTYATPEPTK